MSGIREALQAFFASPAGTAAYGVLVVAIVDFLLGVAASVRDHTFSLDEVAAVLRKHVAGRVFPIWLLLIFGYVGNIDALTAVGLAAAAAYLAETLGSIAASWGPNRETQPTPTD